jgi:TusA-related sulfurtransferase
MVMKKLDANGLKCPQPVLKVAAITPEMKPGDVLEIVADCSSFPSDLKLWCERTKKTLLFCQDMGGGKFKAQIQF